MSNGNRFSEAELDALAISAPSVPTMAAAGDQPHFSEAELDALELGLPSLPGVGSKVLGAGLAGISTVAKVLDAPRRTLWTLGYLASGSTLPDAWEEAGSATNLIEAIAPEFVENNPIISGALGIGLEILGDPLTYTGLGLLTKGGKVAQKAGTLATTWAHQARAGHRALLQFMYPVIEDGALAIARKTLWKGPKGIEALGFLGSLIKHPRSVLTGKVRLLNSLSRQEWTDALESVGKYAARLGEAPIDYTRGALTSWDEFEQLAKKWGVEQAEDAARLAEHLDLPSRFHQQIIAQAAPEAVERAKAFATFHDTLMDLGEQAGIKKGELGQSVKRALREIDWFDEGELGALDQLLKSDIGKAMPTSEARAIRKYVATRLDQQTFVAKADELDHLLAEARAMKELSRKFFPAQGVGPDPGSIGKLQTQLFVIRKKAQALDVEAFRQASDAYDVARQAGIATPGGALFKEQDRLPRYIARVLTPRAKRHIATVSPSRAGDLTNIAWKADTDHAMRRHLAGRFEQTTGGLRKLGPMEVADDLKTIYREYSVDEVVDAVRKPAPASQFEHMQKMFDADSVIDRIDRSKTLASPRKLAARGFYQYDPKKWFDEIVHRTRQEIKKGEFISFIRDQADIGDIVRPATEAPTGWHHIRNVHKDLVESVGDVVIHPELFHEMTQTFVQSAFPQQQAATTIGRAFDKITRAFKTGVTTPESILPGKLGWFPGFPAYHFRNAYSDTVLMGYNGPFSIGAVFKDGMNAALRKEDVLIDAGKQLGKMSGADFSRLGRAYRITFGEDITKMGSKIGNLLENQRRLGYFADRLQRGYSPYQAAQQVKRVLFDYSEMTNFERKVMRRIIPFWSWTRNNVRLQVQTLMQRPGITMAQLRLGGAGTKQTDVPPWVRGRMMVALNPDRRTGEEQMLIGIGLPVEDISELLDFNGGYKEWLRQVAFKANPYLKLGLSRVMDYDVERGRPFDRPTSAPYLKWLEGNSKSGWKYAQEKFGARKRKSRAGESYYTVDPYWDHFMRNLPSARMYGQAKSFAHPDKPWQKVLGWATGFRKIKYHPDRVQQAERQSEVKDVLEAARRVGDVGIFDLPYVRGGSLMSREDLRRLQEEARGR